MGGALKDQALRVDCDEPFRIGEGSKVGCEAHHALGRVVTAMKAEQDGQGFGWLEVLGKIYQELPLGPVDGDGSGHRILRINGPGSAKNDYEEDF